VRVAVVVDSVPQPVIGVRVSPPMVIRIALWLVVYREVDGMKTDVFPSVIGLHVSRLSLVLSVSHAELQLSQRHSVSPTSFEVLQDVPPFSISKGICFSRKNSSIASAVRIS